MKERPVGAWKSQTWLLTEQQTGSGRRPRVRGAGLVHIATQGPAGGRRGRPGAWPAFSPGCPPALYTRLDLGPSLSPSRGLSRRAGLCLLVTPTGHGTYRGPAEGGVALQPCAGPPQASGAPTGRQALVWTSRSPRVGCVSRAESKPLRTQLCFVGMPAAHPAPPLPCAPAKREAWVIGPLVRSQRCSPRLGLPRRRVPAVKCPSSSPRSRAR